MRQLLHDIGKRPFDIVVVGAGINGAGIARDAAMRGLRVLVLEKHDIASGTTSRSTRLIHGGLRYLEHREVPLVREALSERKIQLRMARHLVEPVSFLIPIYEDSRRSRHMIQFGMIVYDALSLDKSMGRHHTLDAEETLRREPGLATEGLRGSAVYFDAQAEFPERLAVEALVSAKGHGAIVLTRARVERLGVDDGAVHEVEFRDLLTDETHTVTTAGVVNVTGPWVDELLRRAPRSFSRRMGGTKGSHLVVDPFPGAPSEAIYLEATDGRPFFVVPWLGRYLIGTTDIPFDGDLDRVTASGDEIDYLIASANEVFPRAGLSHDDVLYTYSGVRPLPYQPDASPGEITRSHIIEEHDELRGLMSIIGGKITTWRRLSEEVVDLVFKRLGRRDPGCSTDRQPLPGSQVADFDAYADDVRARSRLPDEVTDRLLRVYGARVGALFDHAHADPRLAGLLGDSGLLAAEVPFALETELATTLGDVLLRRSMVGLEPSLGLDALEPAAQLAASYLGWSDERVAREIEDYHRELELLRPEHGGGPGG